MADTPRVLSLSETLLHYSGLWPRYRGKMCSLHSFVAYSSNFVGMLVAASFFLSDQEVLTVASLDSASIVLATATVETYVMTLLLKTRSFEDLVSRLRSFAARALRQDTRHILLKMVATERKVFAVSLAIIGVIMYMNCAPILQQLVSRGQWVLPYPAYPVGAEDRLLFGGLYALEAVQSVISGFVCAASDGFVVSLMLVTSHQFEVVAAMISSIRVGEDEPGAKTGDTESAGCDEVSEPLPGLVSGSDTAPRTHAGATPASGKEEERTRAWKEIVALHQDALRNGDDLCELLRTMFFVHYIVTALELSMFLFGLVEEEDKSQKIKFAIFAVCILQRMFLVCYLATEMKSKIFLHAPWWKHARATRQPDRELQSEGVAVALAETAWYDYSPEEKTILQIMMCRAQRPVQLWAGKFAVMSLETYLAILNSAYSYYNILDTLKGKN